MYAVIESGGKQYRVEVGTELEVELLDVEPGQALTLDRVLLVGDDDQTAIGRPLVENATVEAEVLRRDRGPKLIVFKYRPKARRRVKKGHRQEHTILRITDVKLGSKSAAASVRKAEQAAKTERERLEEAATRQASADAALASKLAKAKPADEGKSAKPIAKSTARTTSDTKKATTKSPSKPKATKAAAKKAAAKKAGATRSTAKTKPAAKPAAKPASKPAAKSRTTARTTKAAPKRGRTTKDK